VREEEGRGERGRRWEGEILLDVNINPMEDFVDFVESLLDRILIETIGGMSCEKKALLEEGGREARGNRPT
jgi:hypothetical protein